MSGCQNLLGWEIELGQELLFTTTPLKPHQIYGLFISLCPYRNSFVSEIMKKELCKDISDEQIENIEKNTRSMICEYMEKCENLSFPFRFSSIGPRNFYKSYVSDSASALDKWKSMLIERNFDLEYVYPSIQIRSKPNSGELLVEELFCAVMASLTLMLHRAANGSLDVVFRCGYSSFFFRLLRAIETLFNDESDEVEVDTALLVKKYSELLIHIIDSRFQHRESEFWRRAVAEAVAYGTVPKDDFEMTFLPQLARHPKILIEKLLSDVFVESFDSTQLSSLFLRDSLFIPATSYLALINVAALQLRVRDFHDEELILERSTGSETDFVTTSKLKHLLVLCIEKFGECKKGIGGIDEPQYVSPNMVRFLEFEEAFVRDLGFALGFPEFSPQSSYIDLYSLLLCFSQGHMPVYPLPAASQSAALQQVAVWKLFERENLRELWKSLHDEIILHEMKGIKCNPIPADAPHGMYVPVFICKSEKETFALIAIATAQVINLVGKKRLSFINKTASSDECYLLQAHPSVSYSQFYENLSRFQKSAEFLKFPIFSSGDEASDLNFKRFVTPAQLSKFASRELRHRADGTLEIAPAVHVKVQTSKRSFQTEPSALQFSLSPTEAEAFLAAHMFQISGVVGTSMENITRFIHSLAYFTCFSQEKLSFKKEIKGTVALVDEANMLELPSSLLASRASEKMKEVSYHAISVLKATTETLLIRTKLKTGALPFDKLEDELFESGRSGKEQLLEHQSQNSGIVVGSMKEMQTISRKPDFLIFCNSQDLHLFELLETISQVRPKSVLFLANTLCPVLQLAQHVSVLKNPAGSPLVSAPLSGADLKRPQIRCNGAVLPPVIPVSISRNFNDSVKKLYDRVKTQIIPENPNLTTALVSQSVTFFELGATTVDYVEPSDLIVFCAKKPQDVSEKQIATLCQKAKGCLLITYEPWLRPFGNLPSVFSFVREFSYKEFITLFRKPSSTLTQPSSSLPNDDLFSKNCLRNNSFQRPSSWMTGSPFAPPPALHSSSIPPAPEYNPDDSRLKPSPVDSSSQFLQRRNVEAEIKDPDDWW
eukprot:gnl/Chilomastix_cuspidata/3638.p1 GENE.gnl/Chilomastix_cuspidata/3638~~gnl/Chilomastix_cuspidata/3638.p1  ORF type:complete len:1057 (-),score=178.86 gnl/Chilomastix_cuspidata/3638:136-3306(-)